MEENTNIPKGYKEIKVNDLRLYTNGVNVVISGEPPESDETELAHNCDDMGCGWEHVLMSFRSKRGTCNRIYLDWMKKH